MTEKTYKTRCGVIHYWIDMMEPENYTLVMLPGLTADHRLFDKQVDYFKGKYNLFVWDAPAHAASWPFDFSFDLVDKAVWLKEILDLEGVKYPVLVGQSMGAYVGQQFVQIYPNTLSGFISIDSAPLQRKYYTWIEIALLKHMEPVYAAYPWKLLVKQGAEGCAESAYGRRLMRDMMMDCGDQKRYAKLAGHGYNMLARAAERDLPYEITCPALLICGEKDKAGSTRDYNKRWNRQGGLPIRWIKNAGHNSNTDQPEEINSWIEKFVERL